MENILKRYEYQIIIQDENTYLLYFDSKYYKIGKIIYEILTNSKKFDSIEEINKSLTEKKYTTKQLSDIIKNSILPIFVKVEDKPTPIMSNYWWTGQLLTPKYASWLSKPLKPLFGKLFIYIISLLAITNIASYIFNIRLIRSIPQNYELLQIVITYFLLFFILLIHELGHVAASSMEKQQPQGIRIGLYFFMPMMYVNLTNTWILSKGARTKINLGGVTNQMIINLILFIALNTLNNIFILGIVNKLLIVNTSLIFINLIPFFKFDGYWILSDIIGIPNLLKESNDSLSSYFVKKSPFHTDNKLKMNSKRKYFLLIFSLLRLIFLILLASIMIIFVIHFLFKTTIFAMNISYMEFNYDTVFEVIKKIGILTIICFIIKRYCSIAFVFLRRKFSR